MPDIVINNNTYDGVANVTLQTESDTATFLSTDYVLVGTPLVANEAADMTETDKIYVYIGNEVGYTNGNWYYFNGTSWASGGEYASGQSGISDNARNLLKYILDRVAYIQTGMEVYVNALYQALKITGPAPEQYTILNTLVNVTNSNGATSIAEGSAYSATLSIESGYTWGTVSVSMGGTDITSTAYNSSTHAISIASVTGDIVIIASATAPVTTYLITNVLTHVTNSNTSASIQSGSAYSGTLTADTDYTIDSVTVTMGGVDITATAYDSSDDSITIASVTGDIVITATATAVPAYEASNLTFDGTNYINTGVSLFSSENINRDFRITVDGITPNTSQGTGGVAERCIIGSMSETSPYPGFVVRAGILNPGRGVISLTNNASSNLVIERISGVITVTGAEKYNAGTYTTVFDIPVTLGCELNSDGVTPFRYMGGTIDHIKIQWL